MISSTNLSVSTHQVEDTYPLSPLQQGMLFHSIYSQDNGIYLQQYVGKLHEILNLSAFEPAWQRVIERHPILRTGFQWENVSEPQQIVYKQVECPWQFYDWRDLSVQTQEKQLADYIQKDRKQGFSFSQAPVMRFALFQLGSANYQFIWTFHHILLDGRSRFLILQEFFAFYAAYCQNKALDLPQPYPYKNYIDWQQQQDFSKSKAFWQQQLKGVQAPTPLIKGWVKDSMDEQTTYADKILHLTETMTTALQSLAKSSDLTLNTLVQGAYAILLSRYSQEETVIFGATRACRYWTDIEPKSRIGLFINTLPLCTHLAPNKSLLSVLQSLRNQWVAMRDHEQTPLIELHKWSDIPTDLPLFNTIVVFEAYEMNATLRKRGSEWLHREFELLQQNHYPLSLYATVGTRLCLTFKYEPQHFDVDTINRMAGHFQKILESMLANLQQPISELSLLTETERHQLLIEWNDTKRAYPSKKCVHQLFEEQVRNTPDAIAVVFKEQQLTYQELNERANQLAHYLQTLKIEPDVFVGICVERSLEMLVGLLGILKAGGAYVPLDPAYPKERIAFMLTDSQASVLLTQKALLTELPENQAQVVCLDRDGEIISQYARENPVRIASGENLAYVIYTSGSTGKPKGVQIQHQSLTNFLCAMAKEPGLTKQDVLLAVTTISFDIAGLELYLPLIKGAKIVLASRAMATDGIQLLEQLNHADITVMQATPATWRLLLASDWQNTPHLKILIGGEALPKELANQLINKSASVWNVYGPTETTVWSSVFQIGNHAASLTKEASEAIGRPIANTQIYILDEQLQPVPIGISGELHIGGDGLARGYLNRPELTAEKFIPDPFSNEPNARLYKTGDLARYLPDGNIEYLNRIDNQVKLRGFRIELGEIEAVLVQHSEVREAVVIIREDQPRDKRLVAYIVLKAQEVMPNILRQFLKEKLPDYMVPSAFVKLEAMPLTSNGKVDRRALPVPDILRSIEADFVPPRTPTEEVLATIWAEILRVEQVGIHDNFFELGGHSLLAIQVISRLRDTFSVELPLRSLFESPTLVTLSEQIEAARSEHQAVLPAIKHLAQKGEVPLSFAQQRLWFLDQLEKERDTHNLSISLRITGTLNVAALEQSLTEIVRRHESLRTTFQLSNGEAVQLIGSPFPVKLPVVDLQNGYEVEHEIQRLATQAHQQPFALEQGPLLRFTLLLLEEDSHILLVTMHHIISDGWSIKIFIRELSILHAAFSIGDPSPLPDLPIQYADFAIWQRQWLTGEVLETLLNYWKQQLKGAPPLLELPTDRPRPSIQTYRGAKKHLKLSQSLSQALKTLSHQANVTLFITLLSAFELLLYRYTGQTNIVVGTPIAGRNRTELENLMGFFINTQVLHTDMSGNPSFHELLRRVREVALGAYAHQELPFEKLVEELQPVRTLSHTPVFQVWFNMINPAAEYKNELSGLTIERFYIIEDLPSQFDLTLYIQEKNKKIQLNLVYNADLFDAQRMIEMLNQFNELLLQIVEMPAQKIASYSLVTPQTKLLLPFLPQVKSEEGKIFKQLPQLAPDKEEIKKEEIKEEQLFILNTAQQLAGIGELGEVYALRGDTIYQTRNLARYLPNGHIKYLGRIDHQVKKRLEIALLEEPSVEDCRVLAQETENDGTHLVAYVVLSGRFYPEQLQSRLQKNLENTDIPPCVIVQLATLPLTATGQVDEQKLAHLEVIDSDLNQRWEEKLQSLPAVEQVAVVAQEWSEPLPPLHLSDLLLDWKIMHTLATAVTVTPTESKVEALAESKKPALSYGGELHSDADTPTTLTQTLQRTAQQVPEHGIIYLQTDGSEQIQSYPALLEEASIMLAGLRKRNLKPQDKVIFQLDNPRDFIPAFWGCLLGGFVPVPLSVPPTYESINSTVKRLYHAWQSLKQPLVLTSQSLAFQVRSLSKILNINDFSIETVEILRDCQPDHRWHVSQPDDLAVLLLTSGSTGIPKGVMLSHSNLLSNVVSSAQINHFGRNEISLNWLHLDHVGSLVRCCLRDVYVGNQQIHAPTEMFIKNPLNWLDWIENYRVTFAWAPNFALGLINKQVQAIKQQQWDISCLKSVLSVAEPIVPQTAKTFYKLLAPHGLSINAMHSAWGMSETGAAVVFSHRYLLNLPSDDYPFVEVGQPVPNLSVRIVNDQSEITQEDTVGQVQIKGPMISCGYYQNPELNQASFTPDGWLKTGDLGFLHNGCLTITGRQKELIIINGLNYYSHEIEQLVDEVEDVEASYTATCAIRTPNSNTDELLIFFHTPKAEDKALAKLLKEIQGSVVSNLGVSSTYLIPLDKVDIPKSSVGKILRHQLKARFEAGEFDPLLKRVDVLLCNDNTLPDWFYRKIWRRKEVRTMAEVPMTGQCVVFLDSLGLGEFLCAELGKDGQHCVGVEIGSEFAKLSESRYRINPQNIDDYWQLFTSIATNNVPITLILHLWTFKKYVEISDIYLLEQAQYEGSYSLLSLVKALTDVQGSEHQVQVQFISNHTQFISPYDNIIAYEKSPIFGLIKTLPKEIPWLDCLHIDLPDASVKANAAMILQEKRALPQEREVAYRDGQHYVLRLEKARLTDEEKKPLPFKKGGMYLISGGLGEISVNVATYLLKHYAARLLLIGRTSLPDRETWETHLAQDDVVSQRTKAFLELEQMGGQVVYQTVDVCDLAGLRKVVEQTQSQWTCQLDGVIHLAGIVQERLLMEETCKSLATKLRPKLLGTWALHQLLKDKPKSVFISFSSVLSFFGGSTIGAYSAANNFLESFSIYQRYQTSLQSYCFCSSTWKNVGLNRGSKGHDARRAQGHYAMSVKQGMNAFIASLHHDQEHLIVGLDGSSHHIQRYIPTVSHNLQKLTAYFTVSDNAAITQELQSLVVRDRFHTRSTCDFIQIEEMPLTNSGAIDREKWVGNDMISGERIAPRTDIERQIALIWQKVLDVHHPLSIHDNFFERGGHSLLAVTLLAHIEKAFGKGLSMMTIFQAPTIAQFADILRDQGYKTTWRALEAIQIKGARPPLFFIGSTNYARALAPSLGTDQPVYGLNIFGLQPANGTTPSLKVEWIARQYIQDIQTVQPEGPYYLCGYCGDAKVAFEMAQQLQAQKQSVALLAFIDVIWKRADIPSQNSYLRFWHNLLEFGPNYLFYKIQQKVKFLQDRFFLASSQLEKKHHQQAGKALPLKLQHKLLIQSFFQALHHYVPQSYQGRIMLFLSYEWRSKNTSVLAQLASEGVKIYEVPGYHFNLFEVPQVNELGKLLKQCLEKVQELPNAHS